MKKKRKNGDGTLRLRKDGRWEGRYVVGYDEKGLPKTKSVLAKTKKECMEKLKKLKEELGLATSNELKPDMKFADWLQFWYEHFAKPKLRPSTQASYENNISNHIFPSLGDLPLNKLTQNHLQKFYGDVKENGRKRVVDALGKGLSDRSVRYIHTTCKSALEKAVEEGLIRTNPTIGCKLPPKKTKEMQVLSTQELQRFFIQAKFEGFYELFLLELCTGLRRGELLAVQWSDLNFNTGELKIDKQVSRVNGRLSITIPKTKASIRSIIIPKSVLNVLKKHKENSQSKWLFPSKKLDDMPLDPTWCRKKLHTILEYAGCKKVRFHDLRHTFCTAALSHGMDIKTLSTIIGHVSSATTLDIYTHTTDTMQIKAAQQIDKGFGKTYAGSDCIPPEDSTPAKIDFTPYKGNRRKAGTGCITKINDKLWEGRYSPKGIDGKRISKNIYAHTEEECEQKLAILIKETKAELGALRSNSASV